MAKAASVDELLKSGAHFGHLTRRWNPKMREFIFMQRNGIHIIDLNKTHALLQESLDEIVKVARSGNSILFVGTKKQAQGIISTEAKRCDMPYVTHRWLGGMLTNFVTIKKSISRMEEIHAMQTDGTYDNITKKERLMLDREKEKLEDVMGGISKMGRLPGALFVVDIIKESIAVNEALKLNLPIFALVDTNCDPDVPDYIIPCNDDAAKAIHLVSSNIADAIIEGMAEREAYQQEQLAAETTEKEESEQETKEEISEADVKTTRRKRSRKSRKADQPSVEAKKEETGEKVADQTAAEAEKDKTADKVTEKTAETKKDAADITTEDKPPVESKKEEVAVKEEKPKSKAKTKPKAQTKARSETQAGTEAKAKSETKPKTEAKAGSESKPKTEAKAGSESKPKTEAKAGSESKADENKKEESKSSKKP